MERAEGLSLNQISYKRTRSFADTLKNVLGERLNKTLVVRAALYDLLTSQCDRHSQNVFITESGQIKLIDNLQALQFSWVNCAMDSIFLPGTQKNMVIKWVVGGELAGDGYKVGRVTAVVEEVTGRGDLVRWQRGAGAGDGVGMKAHDALTERSGSGTLGKWRAADAPA